MRAAALCFLLELAIAAAAAAAAVLVPQPLIVVAPRLDTDDSSPHHLDSQNEPAAALLSESRLDFEIRLIPNQGFRFIVNILPSLPVIFDTGSSALIFCKYPKHHDNALSLKLHNCANYGMIPSIADLGSLVGAATDLYMSSSFTTATNLTLENLHFNVVTSHQNNVFCDENIDGIWGAAGSFLNQGTYSRTRFPECTLQSFAYLFLPASFPALVARYEFKFGIHTDFAQRRGTIILGPDSEPSVSSSASCALIGTVNMTGNVQDSSKFEFYQTLVTSCGLRGHEAQIDFASTNSSQVILDSGTQIMFLPRPVLAQIQLRFPLLVGMSGYLDCVLPRTQDGEGSMVVALDLALAEKVASVQGYRAFAARDDFMIWGIPFFAQFYLSANLATGTLSFYHKQQATACV